MTVRLTMAIAASAALAAVTEATRRGLTVTVVIADDAAVPFHLTRMTGARALSVDLATRKAATAARTGRATHEWARMLADDADLALAATASLPELVLFGGGVPIRDGETVIGAVGVSGAAQDEDVLLAKHAASTLTRQFTGEEEPENDSSRRLRRSQP